MSNADIQRGAVDIWALQGEVVSYHRKTGAVVTIRAVVDKAVETVPAAFDSGQIERRTTIHFLLSEVPHLQRGELITTAAAVYSIQDFGDDGFEVTAQVRVIDE